MMSENLTPLTRTAWEGFTPKQKWDVISALRGPDVRHSETIKWFTTSVLRGRMRKVMRVGGLVNTDLNLVILPAGLDIEKKLNDRWRWWAYHFLSHTQEAAAILDIPIVSVMPETWQEGMEQGDLIEVTERFLDALKPSARKDELKRHRAVLKGGYDIP